MIWTSDPALATISSRTLRGLHAAGGATSGQAQEANRLANVDTLMRYFDIIAFGNEFTGKRFARVRKWVEPLRIGLQGEYPAYFEAFVVQQIEDLRRLTNHPIQLYYSPTLQREKRLPAGFDRKKTNVILFYLPRDKIPVLSDDISTTMPRRLQRSSSHPPVLRSSLRAETKSARRSPSFPTTTQRTTCVPVPLRN